MSTILSFSKVTARIWCQYHGITEGQLLEEVSEDLAIVGRIERLEQLLRWLKPSLYQEV